MGDYGSTRPLLAAVVGLLIAVGVGGCGSDDGGGPEPAGDHLVVSLGDSVASGEGNPDGRGPNGPAWDSRRCHRSLRSGQTIAAARVLGDEFAERYESFACSGAEIDAGLLGPYRGIEPRGRELLEPQVDALGDLVDGRTVDAVMVSVGANDVGFAKIVKFCLTPLDRCQKRRFDPELPLIKQFRATEPMEVSVQAAIDRLADAYRELAAALRKEVPLLSPDHVVLVEYFDPTSAPRVVDPGGNCTFGGVDRDEMRWAREHVLVPLNERIHESADELGWKVVDGVDEGFNGHGVCARADRWVATPPDSVIVEGSGLSGTLHPNGRGHQAIADRIVPALSGLVDAADGTATSP